MKLLDWGLRIAGEKVLPIVLKIADEVSADERAAVLRLIRLRKSEGALQTALGIEDLIRDIEALKHRPAKERQ